MKRLFYILIFILSALGNYAQEVKFDAYVSKNSCEVNESIQLEFSSNSNGKLELPELKNCKIIAGPMTGSSTRITDINGKRTMVSSYTYTYVIRFTKKGDQVIPPAKLTVGGKTYHTQPITVSVGGSSSAQNNTAGKDENIFITVSLSKNKMYVGEHVVATYRLYSRYRNYQHQLVDLKFPTPVGFWKNDIENASQLNMDEEMVNGKRYGVVVLKKQVLYAQKSGKLKIDPYECTVRVSDFFNSEDFKMSSNSPSIDVSNLPENAPEGFNGAVGDFSFEVNYSKSELKVNDALDITVTVRGNGNIQLLDNFELELPSEMDKFDPEISDTVNVTSNGMSGKRSYRYTVIPLTSGKYKLPAVKFSYFDPESKKYKTLSSAEFELNVLKGDGTTDDKIIKQNDKAKTESREINPLHDYADDKRLKGDYFFGTLPFLGSLIAGPVLFLLFVFIRRKSTKTDSQLAQMKVKKATRVAIQQMRIAKNLLDKKDVPGFYAEAIKTLYEYTGLKLGLKTSEFTKENIRKKMELKKVDENSIRQFVSIIENCEMGKFGAYSLGNENTIYEECIRLIESLEDRL